MKDNAVYRFINSNAIRRMQVPHENGDHSKSDQCLLFLTNQIFVLSLFSASHLTYTSGGLRQINKTLPHFLQHYPLVPN